MAARRAGDCYRRKPERPDRRLRPARPKAPDRRGHGQDRPTLRGRFLVPGVSRHGAVRGWSARGRAAEDRAIGGGKCEQRPWRAWFRAYLLRKRRAGNRKRLSVLLALHLSARRFFPRAFELASVAVRNPARRLGASLTALPRCHHARPAQRRTAAENVRWRGVSVALRTRRLSARRGGLAGTLRLR